MIGIQEKEKNQKKNVEHPAWIHNTENERESKL